MRSGKRQILQKHSVKDGNPLLDPPIKQDEIVRYRRSQSRLHLPNHSSSRIPPEVGLDHPPDSILIHRALETGVQSLRRVRATLARLVCLSVPHQVTTTYEGQRSAKSWKDFLNSFLPRRNLYSGTLTPGLLRNHLLSPPSSDRPRQRVLFLLILKPTRLHL
jgi:hypothetical protein